MHTTPIEYMEGFFNLSKKQQKQLFTATMDKIKADYARGTLSFMNHTPATPLKIAKHNCENISNPCFTWEAVYFFRSMHEVQKSGLAYTMERF